MKPREKSALIMSRLNNMFETFAMLRALLDLRINSKLTREQLERKKLRAFRRMVRRAYRLSSYYKRLIDEAGISVDTCKPTDFPIMTKKDVITHFDELVLDKSLTYAALEQFVAKTDNPKDLFQDKYQVVSTSGSTGPSSIFVYSRMNWIRGMAQNIRSLSLVQIFSGRKYAYCGAATGRTMASSSVRDGFRSGAKGNAIKVVEANDDIPSIVRQLNDFKPNVLGCYGATLVKLASEQLQGNLNLSLQWVEGFAEYISEADRAYIQAAFKCGMYNMYGCTEFQLMGIRGPCDRYMILHDDHLIYEFQNDGAIVTSLLNTDLPLIRYKTSDILLPVEREATTTYLEIENFIVRETSRALFHNQLGKEKVICSYHLTDKIAGVMQFQMVPQSFTAFDFHITIEEISTLQETIIKCSDWLKGFLRDHGLDNVTFRIIVKDHIAVDEKTRKLKVIDTGIYHLLATAA